MKSKVWTIVSLIGMLGAVMIVSGPGCGDPCDLIAVSTIPPDMICGGQDVQLIVEITTRNEEELSSISYTATQGRGNEVPITPLQCDDTGCTATFCSLAVPDDLVIEVTAVSASET
ncbi:MAG: hypothetical protein D6812_05045, partial [Deltaproteobacteria bacterium]